PRELRTRAPGARSRADLTVLAAVDPATGFLRADFAVPRTVNPDRVEPRGDACVAGGCKSSAAVDRGADFALPRAANFHGCRAVRRCVGTSPRPARPTSTAPSRAPASGGLRRDPARRARCAARLHWRLPLPLARARGPDPT